MSAQPPQLPGPGAGLPPPELFDLAGFGQRLIARIIDTVLTTVPAALLLFVSTRETGRLGSMLGFYVVLLGLSILNDVVLTTIRGGTVGKLLVGTRVVRLPDRHPVTAGIAGRRWASMTVMSLIPILGLIDDLWIFTGQFRQTLHDKFAETIVVRSRVV
jgi:uncharacterized RDD family membrane protein YckC